MKNLIKTIVISSSILVMNGCGGGGGLDAPDNAQFVGGELMVDFPASAMKASLMSKGIVDASATVYGYRGFKIPYTTTDEMNNKVQASGLFVVPTGMPDAVSQIGFSMVSDDHGTIFANKEAPSVSANNNGTPEGASVILTSLGGFATLQPDYIGFGDSKSHYHPFVLKKSLASSTVDFIKAVKVFATNNKITLNNQLFLTGYSEGGYAALATLQMIEEHSTGLSVSMAAPMAGPYDLKTMSDAVLNQAKLPVPSFMANVGYAYSITYGEDVTSVINEPYASSLPSLFDGTKTRTNIDPHLTKDTTGDDGLFVSDFVSDYFTNQNNWFAQAVTQNSVSAWAPVTPVRLVHCEGDEVIPFGISQLTAGTMQALGASDVSIVPVEQTLGLGSNIGHSDCGSYAYTIATGMFAQVRLQTMGY